MNIIKEATDMSVREYWSSLGNGNVSDCSTMFRRIKLNNQIKYLADYWAEIHDEDEEAGFDDRLYTNIQAKLFACNVLDH